MPEKNDLANEAESFSAKLSSNIASGAKKAGKLAGRAVKNLPAAAKIFLIKVGAVGIACVLVIGLLGSLFSALYNVIKDNRGEEGGFNIVPEVANYTEYNEEGYREGQALSEENALIDAYYKYMSLQSFQKMYNGHILKFGEVDDEGDRISEEDLINFAALSDYNGKEGTLYLSSYFIFMLDQRLHGGEFYYPEQIVKPVSYEINGVRVKTVLPIDDETNEVLVKSRSFDQSGIKTSGKETGYWDYGFGSMLQYGHYIKDSWIASKFQNFKIHIHTHTWDWDRDDDGERYWYVTTTCGTATINVSSITADASLTMSEKAARMKKLVEAYDQPRAPRRRGGSWTTVESEYESYINSIFAAPDIEHLECPISLDDEIVAKRVLTKDFSDFSNGKSVIELGENEEISNLRYTRINSGNTYPLNIPLIESAALFSGSMNYEYENETSSVPIEAGTGKTLYDNKTDFVYTSGICSLRRHYELTCQRNGTFNTSVPVPKVSEESNDPWGFKYLDLYTDQYRAYVPEDVADDLDFTNRIDENTLDTLKDLGLLKDYTGGPLSEVEEAKDEEVSALSSYLASFDEDYTVKLFRGASVVNSYKAGKISSYPSSGSITSETDIAIAKQVLSGSFAVAKNVYNVSNSPGAHDLIVLTSGRKTYFIGADSDISSVDWAGRTARSGEDLVSLSSGTEALFSSGEDFYRNETLDVEHILSTMEAASQGKSFLERMLGRIEDKLEAVFSQIGGDFFKANTGSRCFLYEKRIVQEDMRDAVYMAIAFSNKVSYEEAKAALEGSEDLSFLFVGKENSLSLGRSALQRVLIPGIASSIDGFISPTKKYAAAGIPYSESHPYTVTPLERGTEVISIADGTVTDILSDDPVLGNAVVIECSNGGDVITAYLGGLDTISAGKGAVVSKGEVIGSSSEELFFKVEINGRLVDPYQYFYQSVWSSGVPFEDLLGPDGNVDPEKLSAFAERLKKTNSRTLGIFDEYHKQPGINKGILMQCPWWAWGRAYQYLEASGGNPRLMKGQPDGAKWASYYSDTFEVGMTPMANSLVCWGGGGARHIAKYGRECGHIAYVEAIDSDGTFYISESGALMSSVRVTKITGGSYGAAYHLEGFIYLDRPKK